MHLHLVDRVVAMETNLEFFTFSSSVLCYDIKNVIVAWKSCEKSISFLFDLFAFVVAGEKLPNQPNCMIHKLLLKTFVQTKYLSTISIRSRNSAICVWLLGWLL